MSNGVSTGTDSGNQVLEWLCSEEAARCAARLVRRFGLPSAEATADDIVAGAQVAVLGHQQRSSPLQVDNAAAYGTTIMKNLCRHAHRGQARQHALRQAQEGSSHHHTRPGVHRHVELPTDGNLDAVVDGGDTTVHGLRVAIESMADPRRPWLTDAALALVTLAVDNPPLPAEVPQPKAGATPTQARGWAALWFAGERGLFPGAGDESGGVRRKRARHVEQLLDHVERAYTQYRCQRRDRGGAES